MPHQMPVLSAQSRLQQIKPCILIISDDYENLLEVRVRIPFDALYKAGFIRGYHVFHRGRITRSVGIPAEIALIDVVWVQRVLIRNLLFVIEALGGKYVYDIDDNFLVSPAYSSAFDPVISEIVRRLLQYSKVISITNLRLSSSLQARSSIKLEDRCTLSPNMVEDIADIAAREKPELLLLAISGNLPLTESRENFFRAVDRFVRRRGLNVLFVGNDDNDLSWLGDKVIRTGLLNYFTYRQVLLQNNLMALSPLEGRADPATQEFVDGKSDVKMAEFGSCGVPGVYADVAPYRDTPLQGGGLADMGDESAVFDQLDRTYLDANRLRRIAAESVRAHRFAVSCAPVTWMKAVQAGVMSVPIALPDFLEKEALHSQQSLSPEAQLLALREENRKIDQADFGLIKPIPMGYSLTGDDNTLVASSSERHPQAVALFDDDFYLSSNADVRDAGHDAYAHYIEFGIREGRNPNGYFDLQWYVARNPEAGLPGVDPLLHYLFVGAREDKDPSTRFSTRHYKMLNPMLGSINPLAHFLQRLRNR